MRSIRCRSRIRNRCSSRSCRSGWESPVLFAWLLLLPSILQAQTPAPVWEVVPANAILGTILDAETGRPIDLVSVTLAGTSFWTSTDETGTFDLGELPPGEYTFRANHIGYEMVIYESLRIEAARGARLTIRMIPRATQLDEVVVTPGSFSVMGTAPLSRQTLTEENIKNMSWAEDITRAVARLPGVSSNDFSSKFTVRGGENDEVLMIVDGMELYEPFHQRDFAGGLFSIVDVETVEGLDLLTGGFSAEYGDRLSGVFNMRTKRPERGQRRTSVGLSIMNARVYSEGPAGSEKGSYLFSARRGMLDQTFKLIGSTENTPIFSDVFGKYEYVINPKHTLSAHLLHAGDRTKIRDIAERDFDIHDTEYSNSYGWASLKSIYSSTLFSRTQLYGGRVTHDRRGSFSKLDFSDKGDFSLKDKRSYSFYGLKQDWNWNASNRLLLRAGFDQKQLSADYSYHYAIDYLQITAADTLTQRQDRIDIDTKPSGNQTKLYGTGRLRMSESVFLEGGLRFDRASYTGDELWSPRLGLAYRLSDRTTLRGAWGHYYQTQFINNLDVNHGNSGFDPARLAKHYVVGLEHGFESGLELRVEGYFKDVSRLSPSYQNLRDPWEVFPEARNDVVKVNLNGSTARGVEFFVKYDVGSRFSTWMSYALAKAEDDVTSLEFDGLVIERTGKVPRLNNQRHSIYFDTNYRPNRRWHLNLSWQYYVGWPRTNYTYAFKVLEDGMPHFYQVHELYNGVEYPAYHRMDVRINRHFEVRGGRLSTFLHVINLYNRANLRKFDLDVTGDEGVPLPDGQGGYLYPRDDKNWFGITPVIGMSYEF